MARSPPRRRPAKRTKAPSRRTPARKVPARRSAPRKAARKPKAAGRPPARRAAAPARKASKGAKPARRTRASPARASAARPRPAARTGLRIALFGAGGMVGSRIAKEALDRGHDVVAVQRNPGGLDLGGRHVLTVSGDATDPDSVAQLARGCDAIVCAISPRNPPSGETLPRAAKAVLAGARKAGVRRVVAVGGAGSLWAAPGQLVVDTPQFPEEWKPEARGHVAALQVYRSEGAGVDWTFVSPPAMIQPGRRTGRYQSGLDGLLVGKDGQSRISAEDYAVAVVDELEQGGNKGRRMTVAWP